MVRDQVPAALLAAVGHDTSSRRLARARVAVAVLALLGSATYFVGSADPFHCSAQRVSTIGYTSGATGTTRTPLCGAVGESAIADLVVAEPAAAVACGAVLWLVGEAGDRGASAPRRVLAAALAVAAFGAATVATVTGQPAWFGVAALGGLLAASALLSAWPARDWVAGQGAA